MTRKEFLEQPEYERKVFYAELITAIEQNDECFMHGEYIVVMSKKNGKYKVKFGSEVYKENSK